MNIRQLVTLFHTGTTWNAYLYLIYKLTSTATMYLLFMTLQPAAFAYWATVNSIIFLALLWADLGLRKAVPRYCPLFCLTAQRTFLRFVFFLQGTIIVLALPLILFIISIVANNIFYAVADMYVISGIVALEGIVALVRLIFHAHFWQKQFNLLASVWLSFEACANIGCIMMSSDSAWLIHTLFYNKLLINTFFVGTSLILLRRCYQHSYDAVPPLSPQQEQVYLGQFMKHALVMWVTTVLKSLSERNFLVPFFTLVLGAVPATLFKVANDSALVLQRIVIRTIGTTDTSLLTYAYLTTDDKKSVRFAFKTLATKIAALCIPLVGFIFFIAMQHGFQFIKSSDGFIIFFILSFFYLLELMLVPYERLIEVQRSYRVLAYAYAFYLCTLIFIMSMVGTLIGLITTLLLIMIVRLVSMVIIAYMVSMRGVVTFPYAVIVRVGGRTLVFFAFLYLLTFLPLFNGFLQQVMQFVFASYY